MQTTWWALLLKPFIGIVIFAGMFYLPRYIAWPFQFILPKKWRDYLFQGWEHESLFRRRRSRDTARTDKRLLK